MKKTSWKIYAVWIAIAEAVGALWLLILLMILSFSKVDPAAALLQIPYLIWVTFASYLNLGVWIINR